MLPKIKTPILLILVILATAVSNLAQRGGPPPAFTNERFVVLAMAALHRAEVTYQATTGAGSFGTLAELRTAGLIDDAFATGTKYGYSFAVTRDQATYTARAVPVHYGKTGRYSYYIDKDGVLVGNDRNGQPTGPGGYIIDTCALWGIDDFERCTIAAMRTLHSAEVTYAATVGNGEFGSLQQLRIAGLIGPVLGVGISHGYYFNIEPASGPPASFRIWAWPNNYGLTGWRSFYADQTGVVRGADRQGGPAGPTDPPVEP